MSDSESLSSGSFEEIDDDAFQADLRALTGKAGTNPTFVIDEVNGIKCVVIIIIMKLFLCL
jgi:hypothetical protein